MRALAKPDVRPGAGYSGALHQRVAATARNRPEALAIVHTGGRLSYGALDHLAACWAAELRECGVRPGHVVPIVLPRTADLITALLAVLRTGAAYCLLDPAWPTARRTAVVEQLHSPVVVSDTPGGAGAGSGTVWVPPARPAATPSGSPEVRADGDDVCCVFFTSGTTGGPKGTLTTHRALSRLFGSGVLTRLAERTVVPVGAPAPWDAFALELWWALANGGTALLDDEPYLTGSSLRRAVADHGASVTWLTSSVFNMIVDEDPQAFTGLSTVVTGGEAVSPRHARRFLDLHPDVELYNGYGPVESTVFATMHRIRPADCDLPGGVPLGTEVPGTRVHVLQDGQPCPPGVVGEIGIAGEGLCREYLGDEALTREKFVHVAIDGIPVRLYRTGDLGVRDEAGLLHFRGRADRQVKIRGHRIEPAGVEHQIERLLAVRACRVLPAPGRDGRPDRLLAFCVPSSPGDTLPDAVRELGEYLPSYQVPSEVFAVEAFPLTSNGKLDTAALLKSAEPPGGPAATGTPADGATAALVAGVFAAVRGRAAVDAGASFFDQGGSSLDAGRVCTRLGEALGRPVPLSRLYQHPSADALAAWLDGPGRDARDPAPRPGAPVLLTPMQTAFLTRSLAEPADRTGHCVLTWVINGWVNPQALETAVAAVHHRHESLRAAYTADPSLEARVVEIEPPPLEHLPAEPCVDDAVAAIRAAFDEDLAPSVADLWRLVLAPVDAATSVLGVVVHHIAFDGWSEHVLAADLAEAYNAAAKGREAVTAPPLSLDLSGRHCPTAVDQDLMVRVREQLAGTPDMDWPKDPQQTAKGLGVVTLVIPPSRVRGMEEQARGAGASLFVVLLTAFGAAVSEVTGQDDFAVSSPVSQRASEQVAEAIGCHMNTVFFRLRGAALDGGVAALRAVTETAALVLAAQDLPFSTAVELAGPRRSRRPPVAQIMFALQDNPVPRLPLEGLDTAFVRQPYLDLPLEVHAELWPEPDGGLRLEMSHHTQAVPARVIARIADSFARRTESLLDLLEGSGRE
ncbi:amino acid adenylation domain-containing protein [Streptomyces diastaticus]|uniref:amino acid adenylation domain-containing protein n=1 Tax=Streptomyces diastaticus TaxID=1956 RepID=UPI003657155A